MSTEKTPKNAKHFYCKLCDFSCRKQCDYDRHLLTRKHKLATKSTEKIPKNAAYFCDCGKKYKDRTGLWRHKKKCHLNEEKHMEIVETKQTENNKDLINYLIKENTDLKKMLIENNDHSTTINSNNNNIFNIQLFLNEDCKDAMNMTEFIESIQLTLEDMTKINKEGQTEGMSKLLINKLQNIDILKRPMHCSDSKKEIIYVKDEDKWEEEGKDKSKIKKALDKITMKSIETLPNIKQDPDDYVNTVNELLKEPREDKKIISKLAKEVCVK